MTGGHDSTIFIICPRYWTNQPTDHPKQRDTNPQLRQNPLILSENDPL